jgi:hypothetical protein
VRDKRFRQRSHTTEDITLRRALIGTSTITVCRSKDLPLDMVRIGLGPLRVARKCG